MSKRIEQFIPVTGIDKSIAANPDRCIDNPNRLRLSLSYTTGGVNYFTYKNEARGYYLTLPRRRWRTTASATPSVL